MNPPGPPMPTAPAGGAAFQPDQHVVGYENVGISSGILPPPPPVAMGEAPVRPELTTLVGIDEQQARAALEEFAGQNCCYGKGVAREMKIIDLKSSSAFHYTLETFSEARSTNWAYEPYHGQAIDGPMNGPAPLPWDIVAQPPEKFRNAKSSVEVPHTAYVKPCHECAGNGKVRCHHCHGHGQETCHMCHGRGQEVIYQEGNRVHRACNHCQGSGFINGETCPVCQGRGQEVYVEEGQHIHRECHHCHGSGHTRCYQCHGHGTVDCTTCDGHGNLKVFIKLLITWTNHVSDHIVEKSSMPDELIRGVSGQLAFEEENFKVWPVNHFPDPQVNQASNQIVENHARSFASEKILAQRHRIRIVPVNEVHYDFKNETRVFHVYGYENRVFSPDYPQNCCWGCNIL